MNLKVDTGGLTCRDNPYLKDKAPQPWGWAVDPVGLRYTLNVLYDRYHYHINCRKWCWFR